MSNQTNQPTSLTAHVIMAFYNWLSENGVRTHIQVAVDYPGVQVPMGALAPHIKEDTKLFSLTPEQQEEAMEHLKQTDSEWDVSKIPAGFQPVIGFKFKCVVLNITPEAMGGFGYDAKAMWFKTRFSGVSYDIYLPWESIYTIACPDQNFNSGKFPNFMEFDDHARAIYEAIEKPAIREEKPKVEETKSISDKPRPSLKLVK